MHRTTVNPFSEYAHDHILRKVYQGTEYLCHGCHTLGFGDRKRCDICKFDLHDYCAICPDEIHSPKLYPGHSMRLVFQRAEKESGNMRVCDLCGEEVDGLFYHCARSDVDAHPLCLQLPLQIRHQDLHPQHELILGRYDSSTCKVCGDLCQFWWYRCVQSSCAAARIDVHPECLPKSYGEAVNGERSLRPRPSQEQHHPTGAPPASFSSADDNKLHNDYLNFLRINQNHHHHHPQPNYCCDLPLRPPYPYPHHDAPLQRLHSSPPAIFTYPHVPPPQTPPHYSNHHHPFPNRHYSNHHHPFPNRLTHSYSADPYLYQPQPTPITHAPRVNHLAANYAIVNPGLSSSQYHGYPAAVQPQAPPGTSSDYGGDGNPNGKKRKRMYALVGKLGSLLITGISLGFGIPSFFG